MADNSAVKTIRQILRDEGYPYHPDEIRDFIVEGNEVEELEYENYRHWGEREIVVEYNGRYFKATVAFTTDDMSPEEKGWEFDESSVREVKPVEKVVVSKTWENVM